MFSLQQFEEAEERVQAWHEEMRHCLDEERTQDEDSGRRRSWRATLAHCLRSVSRRRAATQPAPGTIAAKTWGK